MMGLTYQDILTKITTSKDLTEQDVELKVNEKLKKLSGLISKEGAAHIVANELGINLMESIRKDGLKIAKIAPGMRGITVVGKVVKMYDVRTFTKNNKEGKVASFLIGDDTGLTRVVLWDVNHIQQVENQSIKPDAIIKLQDGYVRDNQGYKEIHLGNTGTIDVNPAGVTVQVVQNTQNNGGQVEATKKSISALQAGDNNVALVGTVVQVFEPRFYDSCPECNKKVMNDTCSDHGTVTAQSTPILNFFFDDGTSNIRTVAFRDHVTTLFGIDGNTVQAMRNDLSLFDVHKQSLLGKQLQLTGRVTKNDMFDRIEFSVQTVKEADPAQLSQELSA